jgi:mycothiol synthase
LNDAFEESHMQVPSAFAPRAVREEDLPALAAIKNEHWLADYGEPGITTPSEIAARWHDSPAGWLVIADPAGQDVAYGQCSVSGEPGQGRVDFSLFVLPEWRDQGIEAALVDWAEQRAQELAAPVDLWAVVTNQAAADALDRAGYARRIAFQTMLITLAEMPAPPNPAPPLEIRPFLAGRDEQTAYAADEEASLDKGYGQPKTYDQWMRRLSVYGQASPKYWFLAWDGPQVAGGIFGAVEPGTGRGVVHHLGVRRPWRGLGLGAALMLQAFGAFYASGVASVTLDVDAASPTGAQRLYERCGMRVTGVRSLYTRSVIGGRWPVAGEGN